MPASITPSLQHHIKTVRIPVHHAELLLLTSHETLLVMPHTRRGQSRAIRCSGHLKKSRSTDKTMHCNASAWRLGMGNPERP